MNNKYAKIHEFLLILKKKNQPLLENNSGQTHFITGKQRNNQVFYPAFPTLTEPLGNQITNKCKLLVTELVWLVNEGRMMRVRHQHPFAVLMNGSRPW